MKPPLPNLLAALDAKEFTQKELSAAAGWSESKASRLINGKIKDVTMAMVKDLEDALGVSAAYLLDLTDMAQTDDERRMLANYRVAQERDRAIARAAVAPEGREP